MRNSVLSDTRVGPIMLGPRISMAQLTESTPAESTDRLTALSTVTAAPERALWAAILGDAVSICLGRTAASLEEILAARRWIVEPGAHFGGFGWCCDLLGLDEIAIRERIIPHGFRLTALRRRRWLPAPRSASPERF